VLASKCIKKVEVLEYPELGMEAVWKIEVEDFPGTHTRTHTHTHKHLHMHKHTLTL
jgi:tartrate dehydratase beta subunit/fumarate hydratase class I family protein